MGDLIYLPEVRCGLIEPRLRSTIGCTLDKLHNDGEQKATRGRESARR